MQIRFIPPNTHVSRLINQIWIFNNRNKIEHQDLCSIIPNGTSKILYALDHPIELIDEHEVTVIRPHLYYCIGLRTSPIKLHCLQPDTRLIGVDMNALGSAKIQSLFDGSLVDKILNISKRFNIKPPHAKGPMYQSLLIYEIQHALFNIFRSTNCENDLLNYCLRMILNHEGNLSLHKMVKESGYSKRYVDMTFKKYLKITPKKYARIIRFNQLYQMWARTRSSDFYKHVLFDYYYDQSHFIKEFKQFTGYSPRKLAAQGNDLGDLFYTDFPFLQSYG